MNNWNYTNKIGKGALLYGLSGVVYWCLLFTYGKTQAYQTNPTIWGILLLFVGFIIYCPFFIIPQSFSSLATDPFFTGLLLIMTVTIFGIIIGLLMDFRVIRKKKKDIDDSEKSVKPEKGVYLRIHRGDKKPITITEKIMNYCIIILIILWAVLLVTDISGITEKYEVFGYYDKYPSGDTINFDKDSGTFVEKTSGGTKTGTYEMNENLTLLTLCYSDGKTTEYYVENKAFRLVPANRSQYASDQEVEDNLYLKPKVM